MKLSCHERRMTRDRQREDGMRLIHRHQTWSELSLKVDCAGCYFCSWSSSGAVLVVERNGTVKG